MKIDVISFALGFVSCIVFGAIMFCIVRYIAEISHYDPYDHEIVKPVRKSGIPRYDGPPAPPPMKHITEGKDPEYRYKTDSKGSSLHGRIK